MSNSKNKSKELRRVVTASVIGATIEWYDFFLYGVVAGIVFNKLRFLYRMIICVLKKYTY